ncbi:MAG TPA: hypothetical protein VM493_10915 [Vicinamibacterales bacterium]|nr:hypothetical protein [Vicinamibacterales bacterium]
MANFCPPIKNLICRTTALTDLADDIVQQIVLLSDTVLHLRQPLLDALRFRDSASHLGSLVIHDVCTATRLPRRTSYCFPTCIRMKNNDPITEALTEAEEKLRKLKSSDQLVSEAQQVFAELGTRVDAVLEERRSGRDRRVAARERVIDRRMA